MTVTRTPKGIVSSRELEDLSRWYTDEYYKPSESSSIEGSPPTSGRPAKTIYETPSTTSIKPIEHYYGVSSGSGSKPLRERPKIGPYHKVTSSTYSTFSEVSALIVSKGLKHFLGGSCMIEKTFPNDFDIFVLADEDFSKTLVEKFFFVEGGSEPTPEESKEEWKSYKKNIINVIVFNNKEFFKKANDAQNIVNSLALEDKTERVAIFDFAYGRTNAISREIFTMFIKGDLDKARVHLKEHLKKVGPNVKEDNVIYADF